MIVRASESELELENFAPGRLFGPTINQLEHAVVDPNARPYFFVVPDLLRRCFCLVVPPRSFREEPVLCGRTTRMTLRLIHLLWIRPVYSSRRVVPFVNQYPALILYPIRVWSARTEAHQNDGIGAPQAEVHSPLEIHADCRTHLYVGDDIAGLESIRQTEWIIRPSVLLLVAVMPVCIGALLYNGKLFSALDRGLINSRHSENSIG